MKQKSVLWARGLAGTFLAAALVNLISSLWGAPLSGLGNSAWILPIWLLWVLAPYLLIFGGSFGLKNRSSQGAARFGRVSLITLGLIAVWLGYWAWQQLEFTKQGVLDPAFQFGVVTAPFAIVPGLILEGLTEALLRRRKGLEASSPK